MDINLKDIGLRCKKYRVEHGYYQYDVAADTGYSVENISAFETGRNDNSRILMWYFEHGMSYKYLFEGGVKNGTEI